MKAKIISEFLGTAFLLMIVVGSGIMAENLSQGNVALALLINSFATGLGLFILIYALQPISGAHFNPLVTITEKVRGKISLKEFTIYILSQFTGAIIGIFITHLMFNLDILQIATKNRAYPHFFTSEVIASFGLLATIYLVDKRNSNTIPAAVGAYIAAGYWFTSSSSFANPAVTFARIFTDTFCGINNTGAMIFIAAQLLSLIPAILLVKKIDKN